MKTMKMSLLAFVTALFLALPGCSGEGEVVEADKLLEEVDTIIDYSSISGLSLEPGSRIAMVIMDAKAGFWKTVAAGAQKAVDDLNEELGYEGADAVSLIIESPSSELDVDGQINTIDAVLSEHPDALCVAAIDADSCQAQLETARENQIPVIAIDSGLNHELVSTVCATDNYEAAGEVARKLCEKIGDQGQVAVFVHNPSTLTGTDREQGFLDEIGTNHQGVEIVEVIYEEDEHDLVEEVLAAFVDHPDLDAVYGTNEKMLSAILEACAVQEEMSELFIAGFDIGGQEAEAIREGTLDGVVAQNPYGMGYAAVTAAIRDIEGRTNEAFINTGHQWIDGTNIEDEEIQKYLYE